MMCGADARRHLPSVRKLARITAIQTVTAANPGVFLAEVEGLGQPGRRQDLERLAAKLVDPVRKSISFDVAAELIEAGQQSAAVGEAMQADPVQHDVFAIDRIHLERRMGRTQIAGLPRRCAQDEPRVGRVMDERHVADHQERRARSFVSEERRGPGHVAADGDGPDGQLIPRQQVAGEAQQQR